MILGFTLSPHKPHRTTLTSRVHNKCSQNRDLCSDSHGIWSVPAAVRKEEFLSLIFLSSGSTFFFFLLGNDTVTQSGWKTDVDAAAVQYILLSSGRQTNPKDKSRSEWINSRKVDRTADGASEAGRSSKYEKNTTGVRTRIINRPCRCAACVCCFAACVSAQRLYISYHDWLWFRCVIGAQEAWAHDVLGNGVRLRGVL